MVNETLARWSDLAFEAAIAGYVMALVCFGIEFASRRAQVPTAAEAASIRSREARRGRVAVLEGDSAGLNPAGLNKTGPHRASIDSAAIGRVTPGGIRRAPTAPMAVRFGRAGTAVTIAGFAANVLALAFRGMSVGRPPWGNLYEFSTLICAGTVAAFLVVLARSKARTIGFFVMIPIVILMFVAGTKLYVPAGSLVPALDSYWLVIHVSAISLSSGVLMLASVASLLYVLRARHERKLAREKDWVAQHGQAAGEVSTSTGTGMAPQVLVADKSPIGRLPSLATLDRLAYRSTIVAFPVFTFAVIAGALWAEVAWGRYWGWDPKETSAFVTWVLYAGYLHARSTAGWRGVRAAWISVLAFASMIFNLFFINLVVSGLHSYALN